MGEQCPTHDRDAAARYVTAARRMLKDAVSAEFALNPAIDMLLALYLQRHAREAMSSAEVCAGASVTEQVCRHWAAALAQRGLIVVSGERYRLSEEGERVLDLVNDNVRSLAAEHLGPGR